ncbi:MAG: copper chaperone PCu(A)C [Chromatiaceae bacterium]|nr:copper chaperone PCu(A)C [Gammaproteobacteria bacterium]MCB1871822.1 copper chaperone PCu(A)C [Gammaproteobacteria bacterium]MCB1878633.1 copper chaperone PCu(A)C [Gammaproteobacteria bacterium]MCP5447597.1 copper chaperone PCu(A)C [Chromatiaceae bacterium]
MKRAVYSLFTVSLMLAAGLAFAGSAAEDVTVSDAYARAVPPGQPNSASFMLLANGSATAHAVVAAESPVAKVVELHTHTMSEGMMKMRQVEKIDIPANGMTQLEPGGLHVMLIGLTQDLKPNDEVSLTLMFEDGSKLALVVPVRNLQMKMMQQGMGGMEHGKMNH